MINSLNGVQGGYVSKEYNTQKAEKKSNVSGRTIGETNLSDKAAKYYEELKTKYSDMDFILVSNDMKEQAKAMASAYANPNRMVVLIDEEKIERMAEDENFRKQYEGIISNAQNQLPQLQSSIAGTGANVKTFGMQINDNGTASYFAVIDKSLSAQRERIEKKAEEKKEAKKLEEKKEAKAEAKERLENRKDKISTDEDTVTITASSMEELLKKINDFAFAELSNNVQTESELMVGQNIDFRG